jgi:predicted Zn-dependent protease with MMP-like domain
MPRLAEPLYAADHSPENDPTLEDLHAMAGEALLSVPEAFRRHLEGVVIRVAEWPEDEVLEEMGISSPYDLLGLYQGVALTGRSVNDIARTADMIFLYRQPLLAYWEESGFDLRDIVRNTLVHEIGHHFGLSDDAMDALEAESAEEDNKRRTA